MALEVKDNPDEDRFEGWLDGELAGFIAYRRRPGLLALIHTEVDPAFEGKGVGSQLAQGTLDLVRADGGHLLPFCPFINDWLHKHPEHVDLVPEQYRGHFGL